MNEFALDLAYAVDPQSQNRVTVCWKDEHGALVCSNRGTPCDPDPDAVKVRLTWEDAEFGGDAIDPA